MPAEPRQLPLGKLARADFHQLDGLGQAVFAAQMLDDLPVADGLHGKLIFRQSVFQQLLRLRHEAAPEHCVHADVDAGVQIGGEAGEAEKTRGWRVDVFAIFNPLFSILCFHQAA